MIRSEEEKECPEEEEEELELELGLELEGEKYDELEGLEEREEQDQDQESLFKFESPSSTVIAGPSMVGKTVLALSIVKNSRVMYTIPPMKILYAYGVYQKKFEDLEALIPNLTLHHGLPPRELIEELKSEDGNNLVILDDLMDEICNSSEMCSLFTREVHHAQLLVPDLFPHWDYHRSARAASKSLIRGPAILADRIP